MTLKEISNMVGVSVSTVSRVLNDEHFGTEEVRNKVWEAVRKTGYVPNSAAQNLRKHIKNIPETKTKTIICLFGRIKNPVENPYFEHVARAIEHQALQLGYVTASTFSVLDTNDTGVLEKILSFKPDGVVILGLLNEKMRFLIKKHFRNVCYTGQNVLQDEWDQVICDGFIAAQTAVRHLINVGHRKIAYVGETQKESHYEAYCETLKESGIVVDNSLVSRCEQTSEGGYKGIDSVLDRSSIDLPSAIFCSNDIVAIGAIRKLVEGGYKIPRDFSVISIDNINLAQYTRPMLTTVSVPMEELGSATAKLLIDRIEKGHKLPIKMILPSKLIIRESVQAFQKR